MLLSTFIKLEHRLNTKNKLHNKNVNYLLHSVQQDNVHHQKDTHQEGYHTAAKRPTNTRSPTRALGASEKIAPRVNSRKITCKTH